MINHLLQLKPLLSAAFALALIGCGSASSDTAIQRTLPPLGAESPQAVVEQIRQAVAARDLVLLVANLDPAELKEIAEGLVFVSGFALAFSEPGDEAATAAKMQTLNTLLTRYGLPREDETAAQGEGPSVKEILSGLDQKKLIHLIADLNGFLDTLREGGEDLNAEFVPPVEGELSDLSIEGDSASARIGDQSIAFVRVDQRWYARLPEPPSMADLERQGSEGAIALVLPTTREDSLDANGRIWYRFVAPEAGVLRFNTRPTDDPDGFALFLDVYLDGSGESQWGAGGKNILLEAGQMAEIKLYRMGGGHAGTPFRFWAAFDPGVEDVAGFLLRDPALGEG